MNPNLREPRRVTLEEACNLLEITESEIGELVACGRLPPLQEYRVPRRDSFQYFDGPAFRRAVAKIARMAA